MIILLDTNIISTFSKIRKLELLYDVFNTNVFYISSNVHNEIMITKEKGYIFVNYVVDLLQKKKIIPLTLTSEEEIKTNKIPLSFSRGERDSLVICKERNGIFVTNERKVINYCKKHSIVYFDLRDILKALYIFIKFSRNEVNKLIKDIEEKDNIIIKDKKEIFDIKEAGNEK